MGFHCTILFHMYQRKCFKMKLGNISTGLPRGSISQSFTKFTNVRTRCLKNTENNVCDKYWQNNCIRSDKKVQKSFFILCKCIDPSLSFARKSLIKSTPTRSTLYSIIYRIFMPSPAQAAWPGWAKFHRLGRKTIPNFVVCVNKDQMLVPCCQIWVQY
jgi:hypothetical protein